MISQTSRLIISKPYVAIATSIVLHVLIVVIALFFYSFSFASKPRPLIPIISARIVRLGTPRDEKLLPVKTATTPPTTNAVTPVPNHAALPDKQITTNQNDKPLQEALNKVKEDVSALSLGDIIQNTVGDVTDEGNPDGSKEGREATGQLKASYNDRITQKIQNAMGITAVLNEQEKKSLQAYVELRIDDDGSLLDVKLHKSSGHRIYDVDVLTAVKSAAPLPPPPKDVASFYAKGVIVGFCPERCE
jgi:TonB family protein